MPSENGQTKRKNDPIDNFGNKFGPRFGIEKPAIAGPGRPRLPDTVKERRAFLRKQLEEVSVKAIQVVNEIMNDPNADDRDRLRASEISLTHSLPRQEEVDLNESTNPFARIEPTQLPELLRHIEIEIAGSPTDDQVGNGRCA